jgi:hypothetical protein
VSCASRQHDPSDPDVEQFEWFDTEPNEAVLKEEAREVIPEWMSQSERGAKYGFEVLETLPEKDRLELELESNNIIAFHTARLKLLAKKETPEPSKM